MSITTVGSHLIHYEVLGRGRPIIFIHGWLGSWRYWWPTMQALSARHRSFAFDLWGFGDSSKVKENYTLDACVTMLDQFIEQMGMTAPLTLVGHALGACVALRYTVSHPENVSRVMAVSLPLGAGSLNRRLTQLDAATIIGKILGKNNSFAEVDSETRKTDQLAMNLLAAEVATSDLTAELARCDRPILVVSGDQDPIVSPVDANIEQMADGSTNQHYVTLNGCSHFPMLQEKATFNRLLLDFTHASEDVTKIEPKEMWKRRVR